MNEKNKDIKTDFDEEDTDIDIRFRSKKKKYDKGKKKKTEISKSNFFIRTAILVFTAFCVITIVKLQFEFNQLKETKNALIEDIDKGNDRIGELHAKLNTEFNEEYIIKIAKEKLNLRLPEEIIFYNDLNK